MSPVFKRIPKPTKENKCIIRSNKDIKDFMVIRMAELNINVIDVVKEAKSYRLKISQSSFSRWMNATKSEPGVLTQRQILWLCKRYGIDITLTIEYQKDYDPVKAAIEAEKFTQTFHKKY